MMGREKICETGKWVLAKLCAPALSRPVPPGCRLAFPTERLGEGKTGRGSPRPRPRLLVRPDRPIGPKDQPDHIARLVVPQGG